MGDFDPAFIHTLAVQSWSMYGVGMFLILLRMYESRSHTPFCENTRTNIQFRYARIHRLGFKGIQADDYIMVFAGVRFSPRSTFGIFGMLLTFYN